MTKTCRGKSGFVHEYDAKHKSCPECIRIRRQEPEYKEKNRARRKAWYEANREKHLADLSRRYHSCPERRRKAKERAKARNQSPEGRRVKSKCMSIWHRKNNSGHTPEMVEALRAEQDGKCAICGVVMDTENKRSNTGEHADHCHETQTPRALLCSMCNKGLGVYEKFQKPRGVNMNAYEDYINRWKKAGAL